jgi:NADPH-dependent curcumin reductase CurA
MGTPPSITLGFNIIDHRTRVPEFLHDVSKWMREGRIKHREHVVEGLDNTPNAFTDLLSGRNFGKVVIRLSE